MLSDDDSEDGKQDIANHFLVSEQTVDNLAGANIMAW